MNEYKETKALIDPKPYDFSVEDFARMRIDLLKECYEMLGIDLGQTNNKIEYKNYLINQPPIGVEGYSSMLGDLAGGDFSNYAGGVISLDQMMKIFPKANRNYIGAILMALDKYGSKVGLSDKGKLMVLGQMAEETGQFIYTHELGKGQGKKYGKYYGRGPIQITWNYNYKAITDVYFPKLGIDADIFNDPDLCCTNLGIGAAASLCWFLIPGNGRTAVTAANNGDVKLLTNMINGGYTHYDKRVEYTQKIFNAIKN